MTDLLTENLEARRAVKNNYIAYKKYYFKQFIPPALSNSEMK
jgi:hypothetical protein